MSKKYIPNILTMLRFPLTILFLYGIFQPSVHWRLIGTGCFFLSALTDLLDGILARRYKATTRLGAFLDPLADKVLVLSGFVALLFRPGIEWNGWTPVIVVCVIVTALREIGITLLRSMKVTSSKPLVTSIWGKAKTMTQMLTLIVALSLFAISDLFQWQHPFVIHLVGAGIVAASILAAISATDYLKK